MAGGQAGQNLGSAYVSVKFDAADMKRGVDDAKRYFSDGMASLGTMVTGFGDSLSSLGGNLTTLTAPLAAFGITGLKSAADFDELMKQIEIFGGVTGPALESVKQKALDMGAATKFSSSDAAAAMLDLLKAGLSLEDTMSTLPSVLDLAAAGEISLATAAGITTSALAQFKLGSEDAGRVSNALARAANASRADVSDMGQALQNAGPVAAQFGLSIEDTSAYLAVFAQNGIQGAEAGTQLKSMLLNMYESTDKTKAAWNELGVSLYDSQGNMRDLNTVIKEMDASMDKLPVEDQNRLMAQLGGSYGIVGLNALRASGGIDDMTEAMAAAPDAATIAAGFMGTFKGKVDSLMGSIETFQVQVLTPFMNETLGGLVEKVTNVVNSLTLWAQQNPELANTIVKVLAGVTALGPSLMIAGKAIAAIGGMIAFALSPLGLLTIAVTGAVAAFKTNFLGFRDFLQSIVASVVATLQKIPATVTRIKTYIQDAIKLLTTGDFKGGMFGGAFEDSAIVDFFLTLREVVLGVTDTISGAFRVVGNAIDFIQNAVAAGLSPLLAIGAAVSLFAESFGQALGMSEETATGFRNVVVQALGGLIGIFNQVRETVQRVVNALSPMFAQIGTFVTRAIRGISDNVGGINLEPLLKIGSLIWSLSSPLGMVMSLLKLFNIDVLKVFESVTQGITLFFGALNDGGSVFDGLRAAFGDTAFIDGLETGLASFVTFITESLIPGLQQLADWFITDALPAVVDFVTGTVIPAVQGFFEMIGNAWTAIAPTLEALFNWFVNDALPLVVNFITGVVIPAVQGFIQILTDIWNAVSPALGELVNWFVTTGLPAITTFLDETVIPAVQDFIDILMKVWNDVSPFLFDMFDWFTVTGLPMITAFIEETVVPAIQDFIDLLSGIWNVISPTLEDIYDWFIVTGLPEIKKFIEGPVTDVIQGFINILTGIWETIKGPLDSLKTGFETVFNFIRDNVIKPVVDAIDGLVTKVKDALVQLGLIKTEGAVDVENIEYGQPGGLINQVPGSKDSGGYGAAGQPQLIGIGAQPELFVPSSAGNFIPNFDKAMQQMMGAGGNKSEGPLVGLVNIYANDEAGGRAAARGFEAELTEIMRSRG